MTPVYLVIYERRLGWLRWALGMLAFADPRDADEFRRDREGSRYYRRVRVQMLSVLPVGCMTVSGIESSK